MRPDPLSGAGRPGKRSLRENSGGFRKIEGGGKCFYRALFPRSLLYTGIGLRMLSTIFGALTARANCIWLTRSTFPFKSCSTVQQARGWYGENRFMKGSVFIRKALCSFSPCLPPPGRTDPLKGSFAASRAPTTPRCSSSIHPVGLSQGYH